MARDICSKCKQCQLTKISSLVVVLPPVKIVTYSFELKAMDHLLLFGSVISENVGCLVVADHKSKWVSTVPIMNKTAAPVADAQGKYVLPFFLRIPDKILSDNGREFISEAFLELIKLFSIKHLYSTQYRLSSNSAEESQSDYWITVVVPYVSSYSGINI